MSPFSSEGRRSAMVLSTTAAGTMSHTARGLSSFFTKSASEVDPIALSCTSSCTVLGHVEDHALVPTLDETAHHVRAHPAEADHSELHRQPPYLLVLSLR